MAENSKIEWTDHTFNPWRGCEKVSPGCKYCYAEAQAKRNPSVLGVWGPNGTRVVASDSAWKQVERWNRESMEAINRGEPARKVFCGSFCDVCEDRDELVFPRMSLVELIKRTPYLKWLLLTKRPENYTRLFNFGMPRGEWPRHVWAGCTVETQEEIWRIEYLRQVPARVRFLSIEPMLGPIVLPAQKSVGEIERERNLSYADAFGAWESTRIHWVICGGESHRSRPRARPFDPNWARRVRDYCARYDAAFFMKQFGDVVSVANDRLGEFPDGGDNLIDAEPDAQAYQGDRIRVMLTTPKGGDMSEWPEDLRVREFPKSD